MLKNTVHWLSSAVLVTAFVSSFASPTIAAPTGRVCGSSVSPPDIASLLASEDIEALVAAAERAPRGSAKADLLGGIAASYVLNDSDSEKRLRRYITRPGQPFKFEAGAALADVQTRLGKYADAADTKSAAIAAGESAGATSEDILAARAGLRVLQALRGVPPQISPAAASGDISISRDAAGLAIGELAVNGRAQRAVLDTGANLSVVVRSKAASLGLQILPDTVTIASPNAAGTPAHMAVADRLMIGGLEFRNVVFIVFPDEALTFAGGAYRIEAILGFPVLAHLGRLQFSGNGKNERLTFTRKNTRPTVIPSQATLFIDGLTPKIIACSVPDRRAVQFALDSGANTSSLRPLFAKAFPNLVKNARVTTATTGAVGGTVTRDERTIANIDFDFDGTVLTMQDLGISGEAAEEPGDHGRLGQDALRAKGGYVLDFDQMRFELGGNRVP